jgi:hypothetical protein
MVIIFWLRLSFSEEVSKRTETRYFDEMLSFSEDAKGIFNTLMNLTSTRKDSFTNALCVLILIKHLMVTAERLDRTKIT